MEKKLFSQANLQKSFELILKYHRAEIESLQSRQNALENRVAVLESRYSGDPIAFAILSEDDGSLTFYQDYYLPEGKYHGKTVTEVYTALTTDTMYPSWYLQEENIRKVAFDESFANVKLTSFHSMFSYCAHLEEVDTTWLDTSEATDFNYMFYFCDSLAELDVSNWNTSNAESLYGMFHSCESLRALDVSNWDTSKVTSMSIMFGGCRNLTTIYSDDLKFVTTSLKINGDMFTNCTSLVGGNGTTYNSSKLDASMAHIDTASNPGYFTAK